MKGRGKEDVTYILKKNPDDWGLSRCVGGKLPYARPGLCYKRKNF